MSYIFEPPSYIERPVTGDRLTETRLKMHRGISVLKDGAGHYTQVTYPTQDMLAAAATYYLGGHSYTVDDVEAAALQAAGYSVTPVAVVTPPSTDGTYTSTYSGTY